MRVRALRRDDVSAVRTHVVPSWRTHGPREEKGSGGPAPRRTVTTALRPPAALGRAPRSPRRAPAPRAASPRASRPDCEN